MSKIRKFIYTQRFYLGILLLTVLFNLFLIGDKGSREILPAEPSLSQLSLEKNWNPEAITEALQKKPYLMRSVGLLGLSVILAFLAGLLMDVRYIALKFTNKEILKSVPYSERANWGIWDVCKVIILFLFFNHIIYIFESLFFHLDIYLRMVINTYILDATVIALVIFMVTVTYRQGLSALGLSLKNWLRDIIQGIVGYVSLIPVLFLIMLLVFAFARRLDYQPPIQPVFDLFLTEKRRGIVILSTILIAVLGPIGEEIFFRGFMYKAIRNRFGVPRALVLSAAIFAALHNNPIGFFPIMALGILLAYLYEKSDSLIPSITVHIIHNSFIVLFIFLAREVVKLL